MDLKPDFQRYFWIFSNEDAGYESGQRPSGHIKIEVREGRGKLRASVQNLLESVKLGYRLYLLGTFPGGVMPVDVGSLHLIRNKGTLEWDFNPLNVAGTGYGIRDFEVAAVLVEYKDRENISVICPLAAYKGNKTPWRNSLTDHLYIKKPLQIYTNEAESYMPAGENVRHEENVQYEENAPEPAESTELPENTEYTENEGYPENAENQYFAPETESVPPAEQPAPGNDVQPELNTNCLYLNSNMCGAYVNTGASNPCMGCTLHDQPEANEGRGNPGNVERLRVELDNSFERYDPFHTKRSDYTWWKVTNPVNLNNILYQCNIRSPLLFNPAVMMSHFKYRHLIIGIYTDMMRQKEYVVCGVFGMNMVDRKPFGDMCKWIQTEGTKPRYGAFGYWIVYLDPETGKILSLR